MKIAIAFFCLFFSGVIQAGANLGHRGGCEHEYYHHMELPENSLICLAAGLVGLEDGPALQYEDDYDYLEFDVRETKDHQIVVYHGGSKGSIFYKKRKWYKTDHATIPYKGHPENQEAWELIQDQGVYMDWDDVKVKDLTLEQIKMLKLEGNYDQTVPTIDEWLDMVAELGTTKPVMVELKEVYSDQGRINLIDSVYRFKQNYADSADIKVKAEKSKETDFYTLKVGFMIRKQKIKSNMGKEGTESFNNWCEDLVDMGFKGVFKTRGLKNVCD